MVQQPLDRVRCGPVKFLCTTLAARSMPIQSILWDLDDDPNGNVQHCAQHGVTKTDVEEVLQNADTIYPITAYDVTRRQRA
jgi:hypothetical protein